MKTTKLQTEVCVAGGGMAGICAALAAARNGANVILVQDRSVLGGNASSEIRMHIVGASCSGRRPAARESGIIDELRVEDSVRNPHRAPSMFDLLLYDKIAREPRIRLLLDTAVTACRTSAGAIADLTALRNSTEDVFSIEAAFYIDCSGDGRLGAEAHADFRMGRESRSEYDESHASAAADRRTLGSTILFMASRKDRPVAFDAPAWARRFTERDLRLRSHREWEYGYWWAEWGGELDTIGDNAAIRHELLRIALGVWHHVKNDCTEAGDPGASYEKWQTGKAAAVSDRSPANWSLDWIGMLPGKRESRRLLGPHVLTENDVVGGTIFPDEVAYGGWWIDLHPPAGVDAVEEYPCNQVEVPHLYSIPLRCLYSRNVPNLFFAGRNISATHVAFASTRVMATCALTGQAAGTAAALACARGVAEAGAMQAHVADVQSHLLRDDMFLLGRPRAANDGVAASGCARHGFGPAMLLTGFARATSPALHPTLPDSPNQWRSVGLPARLELRYPQPRMIREIHLTFDTGFGRELTLSMSDAFSSQMIRGPQPETVRDYTVALDGRVVVEERGNYLRKRVHKLRQPAVASLVELTVMATNGIDHARVFEMRVY